ncbi:hypothetical protein [Burkholderia glumae]|uniref:hypothetical protein n=1 Tax=Burkholderia glumae TaxID=337 RepID=UPI002150ACD9|nr:hypothetical protein [Burkholderia glumae]
MADDLSAPMPPYGTPFLNGDGRTVTEVWWRFLLKLQRRGGGAPGIDLTQLIQRVDDVEGMAAAAAPSFSLLAALIGRVVELERRELGFVPVAARAQQAPSDVVVCAPQVAAADHSPVARPAPAEQQHPEPAAPPASVRVKNGQLKVASSLVDGAGSQAATLTNAPLAGNPTKWIPINDNGTVRRVPAW